MVSVGLFVRLEAKHGRERDVEEFLREALPLVEIERGTTAWFALRFSSTSFGIFDAFPDEAGRQAHLAGRVAAALATSAPELLAAPPIVERADALAWKLPHSAAALVAGGGVDSQRWPR